MIQQWGTNYTIKNIFKNQRDEKIISNKLSLISWNTIDDTIKQDNQKDYTFYLKIIKYKVHMKSDNSVKQFSLQNDHLQNSQNLLIVRNQ